MYYLLSIIYILSMYYLFIFIKPTPVEGHYSIMASCVLCLMRLWEGSSGCV